MVENPRIVVYSPPGPKWPFLVITFEGDGKIVAESSSSALLAHALAETSAFGRHLDDNAAARPRAKAMSSRHDRNGKTAKRTEESGVPPDVA